MRVNGPTCASVGVADTGKIGTRPNWALIPKIPDRDAGIRMEPPPSVPRAIVVMPAAILAAAPALDPPGVLLRSHGLQVIPVKGESPTALHPNSLVVVLPIKHPPDLKSLSTDGASYRPILLAKALEPEEKRISFTDIRSFTETGSPCNKPRGAPSITACSANFA